MTKTRHVLTFLWFAPIAIGLAVMVGMLTWSFRLAGDFSGRYGSADFHHRFWSMFITGEALSFFGCLGLSVTFPFKMAIRAGLWTIGASLVLLSMVLLGILPLVNFHDWTGASVFTLGQAVFCGGIVLAVVGSLRLVSNKLRSRRS